VLNAAVSRKLERGFIRHKVANAFGFNGRLTLIGKTNSSSSSF